MLFTKGMGAIIKGATTGGAKKTIKTPANVILFTMSNYS